MSNVIQFPARNAPEIVVETLATEPLNEPVPMMVEAGVSAVGLLKALVAGGFTVNFDQRHGGLIVRPRKA